MSFPLWRRRPIAAANAASMLAMVALMGAVTLLLLEVRLGRRVLEFY